MILSNQGLMYSIKCYTYVKLTLKVKYDNNKFLKQNESILLNKVILGQKTFCIPECYTHQFFTTI